MSVSDILPIVLRIAVISVVIYFLIAFGLILSQGASDKIAGETIDFSGQTAGARPEPAPLKTYQARDGATLGYRHYGSGNADAPLVIFIHGSGWHGGAYDGLARSIAGKAGVEVALPDLRGHGPDPQTRGDIAHVGQFEEDIADLAALLRKPGQPLVLGGHSSGGGLVVRFAGGDHRSTLDGAVLLAPFLKYNAPTTRPNSGGWARPLTRRIIGLSMLNAVGITALNGLTAIQFNFPAEVLNGPEGGTATTSYSYRLNTAYAPRNDYLADIATLPPFLLIAGADDESFVASGYEPLMKTVNPDGRYRLLDGQSHLGVIDDERTAELIAGFLGDLPGARRP
ncbi:alpha/beta hydrolase [Hoeflea alexandrii]|uniref:Alpha/beta fold hydrolase n=1 Tax=Hoeflea alexandrii TaxID=288436 RepID=A0ABT1CTB6_9HYPH|nr:alpha/beta fold hydrolase [Hoeflea alexandrii]MCO6408636.1 alpha/beta fold hydrolase [Hoeflea alexandrii]